MTKFEKMLVNNGYFKFSLNESLRYVQIPFELSSMTNLDHRYIHSSETDVLIKIKEGKKLGSDDFPHDLIKNEICFGLHEHNKPSTLIYPRPRINIKRIIDGNLVISDEIEDDSMNIVLDKIDYKEILKAMFDKNILLEIDLTKNN